MWDKSCMQRHETSVLPAFAVIAAADPTSSGGQRSAR
jgi:hypothetical protein